MVLCHAKVTDVLGWMYFYYNVIEECISVDSYFV